jgi:hypothetical protein
MPERVTTRERRSEKSAEAVVATPNPVRATENTGSFNVVKG